MRRLWLCLAIAATLLLGSQHFASAASARNPIFGTAKVALLSNSGAEHVTAKGYYSNYYGATALIYLKAAYIYQYYAYYSWGGWGNYAWQDAFNGAVYSFAAYKAWLGGY